MKPKEKFSIITWRLLDKAVFLILIFTVSFHFGTNAQEFVFLHTDKSDYVSGENIQFKAYLSNLSDIDPKLKSKIVYFQLLGPDKSKISGLRANIDSGIYTGYISLPISLKSGYYCLNAYTNAMRNYPWPCTFYKKILIVNQNENQYDSILNLSVVNYNEFGVMKGLNQNIEKQNCTVESDKNIYHPKDKIKLKLKLINYPDQDETCNLSVSVTKLSPFCDTSETESLVKYYDRVNSIWKNLYKEKQYNYGKYLVEKNSFIFSGKVFNKLDKTPLSNVTVLLASPDSIANLQYYKTGNDGAFYFELKKFYDNRLLNLQLLDSSSVVPEYYFIIDNRDIQFQVHSDSLINLTMAERNYLENIQRLVLVNKIYFQKKEQSEISGLTPEFNFYGSSDRDLIPSDYEAMLNFSEMTRNYVWGVRFKNIKNNYYLNMIDYEVNEYQDKNALFLLNSIPVFRLNVLESLNSESIQKIEMKNKHVIFGDLNFYGIFSVQMDKKLSSEIFSKLNLPFFENKVMPESFIGNITLDLSRQSIGDKIPDFRQVLYWEPNIKLNKGNETEIEFSASDLKAGYIIQVQGITSDNKPIYGKTFIEVK
ncbi:MAG: hypothetical protein U0W24_02450 [Bacteroidales bacterium]